MDCIVNVNKSMPVLKCWVCRDRLLNVPLVNVNVVTTVCGHVYHYQCINKWYNVSGDYTCPVCRSVTNEECVRKLLFHMHDDDEDYLLAINQRDRLLIENSYQRKELKVYEIRLTLLSPNKDEFYEKFKNLKWNNLTLDFQEELRDKVKLGFTTLNIDNIDLSFLSSESLIKLISYNVTDSVTFPNFLIEYYKFKFRINGHVSLGDFSNIFKYNLLERLRNRSSISSLELEDLPANPNILHMLLEDEGSSSNKESSDIVLKIIELFFQNVPAFRVYELCKIIIMSQICLQISNNIKLFVPCIDRFSLNSMIGKGILKWHNERYTFVHESVKQYLVSILFYLVRQNLKLTLENCYHLFFENIVEYNSLQDYMVRQFNGFECPHNNQFSKNTEHAMSCLSFAANDTIEILTILALMKIKNTSELVKVFRKFESFCHTVGKNVWEVGYQCIIGSSVEFLKLPHFASLRGNLPIMHTLHNLFVEAKHGDLYEFMSLIHAYSSYTVNCSEDEISMLKEFISFLLSLEEFETSVKVKKTERTPLTVHIEILKLIMNKGFNNFQKIWDMEKMLLEIGHVIGPEELRDKMRCLNEERELAQIIELYCSCRAREPHLIV